MKRELYEKVFINSEEDLPKEGKYIAHSKKHHIIREFPVLWTQIWLDIDWYLRPVPEVTDESDSHKYCIDTQQP